MTPSTRTSLSTRTLDPGKDRSLEKGEPEVTYEATLTVEPTQVTAHVGLGIPSAGKEPPPSCGSLSTPRSPSMRRPHDRVRASLT